MKRRLIRGAAFCACFGALAAPVLARLVRLSCTRWLVVLGAAVLVVAFTPVPWSALPMLALVGATGVVIESLLTGTIQDAVPDRYRAGALGLADTIMVGACLVGSLVGKPRPATPAPAAALSAYAGTFANYYYGPAQIIRRGDRLILKVGPAGIEYPLAHWDGNAFTFVPSSENAPDGSVSLATFKAPSKGRFRELTIEYLDESSLGTFRRK